MRRVHGRSSSSRAYECGCPGVLEWMCHVCDVVLQTGGPLGDLHSRAAAVRLNSKDGAHHCPASVFPLPMPSQIPKPRRGRARLRASRRELRAKILDVQVCILNLLHAGRRVPEVCCRRPTMAQIRCLVRMDQALLDFLREDDVFSGESELQEFMLAGGALYGAGLAKPLGLSAGVPPRAADVNLGELLEATHPRLAAQVRDPAHLLLPPDEWPELLPSVRSILDATYSKFVDRNVAAGLQDLSDESGVAHFQGSPIVGLRLGSRSRPAPTIQTAWGNAWRHCVIDGQCIWRSSSIPLLFIVRWVIYIFRMRGAAAP